MIYEGSPSEKLPVLAAMIREKLAEGYRCLYLNSAPMVAGIRSYLAALNLNVVEEIAKARLVLSSEPTSTGNGFDVDGMLFKLEDALDQALSDGYKGLWATGDMSWEFSPGRDFSKLQEYELRLEDLFRRRPELSGICQYHRDTLPDEAMRQGVLAHQAIFINETLSHINPHHMQSTAPSERTITNPELDELINEYCQL